MNKKRFALPFAVMFAVTAMCATLAACGKDDGEGKEPGPGPGPSPSAELVYPEKGFNRLYENKTKNGAYKAHDPVVVEADGKFYAFSTDNDAGYGVQVRKSDDLVEWEFVGAAIPGYGATESEVKAKLTDGTSELQPVYEWISQASNFDCYTLWAPDVVPAKGGGYWLYSSWTTTFGSSRSVIFQCHSDNVTGPYTYVDMIVRSPNGGINAIDPSIYYTPDGKMFMSYGSFAGGIAAIELNPDTGLRKDTTATVDTVGTKILPNGSVEGSVIEYKTVPVYKGDIATEEYDASKWENQSKYYMMGSHGALANNYNMRVWTSDKPDEGFTSERGNSGLQIAGAWTWRKEGESRCNDLNYFIPGHNDMITTSKGVNLLAYHVRTNTSGSGFDTGVHYLYTSMYDFNSKGQMVMNPNRYNGETYGKVEAEDILTKTEGKYSVIQMTSKDYGYNDVMPTAYAQDCVLREDGTITGAVEGTWKLYGDRYVYIKIGEIEYYGTAMPAMIRQYQRATDGSGYNVKENGGLTISAISDAVNGQNHILYLNMQF